MRRSTVGTVALVLLVTSVGALGAAAVDPSDDGPGTSVTADRTSPFDGYGSVGVASIDDGRAATGDGGTAAREPGGVNPLTERALLDPLTPSIAEADDIVARGIDPSTGRALLDPLSPSIAETNDTATGPSDGGTNAGASPDSEANDPRGDADDTTASDDRELGPEVSENDTDGDGLADDREGELGTNATDADTDGDGLADARERELGTDPIDPDTDGDRLLDGWEVRGETPTGASLPESDPLVKNLYVQVDYSRDVPTKSSAFYDALRAEFADMPVDNPDNSTGIALHVREGEPINESARFTGDNFWELKERHYEDRLGPRAGVYHQVVVTDFGTDQVGYGEVGGRFSVVAARAPNQTQRHVVVHELLHNVVGRVQAAGACDGDPKHYCDGGYLTPRITPGEDEFLPPAIAAQLERDGFAE